MILFSPPLLILQTWNSNKDHDDDEDYKKIFFPFPLHHISVTILLHLMMIILVIILFPATHAYLFSSLLSFDIPSWEWEVCTSSFRVRTSSLRTLDLPFKSIWLIVINSAADNLRTLQIQRRIHATSSESSASSPSSSESAPGDWGTNDCRYGGGTTRCYGRGVTLFEGSGDDDDSI